MGYSKTVVRMFKGLSQSLALTAGSPEFARDCINVIPSIAGLAKLRVPTALSAPVALGVGSGPDQFALFEGSAKKVLGFFGRDIYVFSLDDFVPTFLDNSPDYVGLAPWSVVMSNNAAFLQNGVSIPLKYTGSALEFWGIQRGITPTIGTPGGTGITVAIGRQYRVAYKNSVTGHVGSASAESASTGAIVNQGIPVTIDTAPDAQIDSARLYATLDGGADYFFHSEIAGPFPQTITDTLADTSLDQSERAPLINDQPPKAVYTCLWGSRIFMFNLPAENPKWIAYTGYNRIFVGRPEESCPPLNRIKIETGADDLSGGGVIAAGVIAFDRSNKMFMARGQAEDISVTAPVEFTLFLKQLPYQIGCASHFTIQSTVRGLVWLSSDLEVFIFDGQSPPQSIGEGAEPILRSINVGAVQNARSAYWQYKGRDWYVLAVATGSSAQLNKILIFDLEENAEKNVGTFPLDIGNFQSLGIVEMADGSQKLVIGQGGVFKELSVTASTINGIEETISSTSGTLGAWWRGGLIGNENPEQQKFFRWGRVTADQAGIRVKRYVYQDDIAAPAVIEYVDTVTGGKIITNKKARRLCYELRFRDEDVSQNILELLDMNIPLAER